jgi:hypothetical protein
MVQYNKRDMNDYTAPADMTNFGARQKKQQPDTGSKSK